MHLAHRIQLDPTYQQAAYFRRACGTSRLVWNWALAEWTAQYAAGGKPHGTALKKQFNAVKYEQFPWMKDIHRDAHSQPFTDLQKAFVKFFKKAARRPRFKKRGGRESFYVANDRLKIDDQRIRLPVIGWVRMTESLRFSGKILGAVVSRQADRWYISIQVDVGDYTRPRTGDGIIGIDLGIKTAMVTSDGDSIESPKPLKKSLKRLRRLNRSLSRRRKGSNRRQRKKLELARAHARIRNIRHDCLHKATTRFCRENQAVVIEDLCVKGMLRNRKLARAIADIGFGEFRRQVLYKSRIYGTQLIIADRWFPSSKTCNACGQIKSDLDLSDRVFRCAGCDYECDRDLNAAMNLRDLHTAGLAEIHARGQEGSGGDTCGAVKPYLDEARTKTYPRVGTH